METELDYIETMNEDKLLSNSPTKTSVGSPRRSPRFSKPSPQSSSLTKSSIGSPRRSPRLSKMQPLQESSKNDSPSSVRASDLAVTCSPERKAARVALEGTERPNRKGLAKVGSHLKRKSSEEEIGSGAVKRDTKIKLARSADSREVHHQEDSRRACSILSSSASRTAGSQDRYLQKDKRVAMSSTNRTHCADSEGESPARE